MKIKKLTSNNGEKIEQQQSITNREKKRPNDGRNQGFHRGRKTRVLKAGKKMKGEKSREKVGKINTRCDQMYFFISCIGAVAILSKIILNPFLILRTVSTAARKNYRPHSTADVTADVKQLYQGRLTLTAVNK